MRDAIEDLRADVAYWTAEAPRAEAYSPRGGFGGASWQKAEHSNDVESPNAAGRHRTQLQSPTFEIAP